VKLAYLLHQLNDPLRFSKRDKNGVLFTDYVDPSAAAWRCWWV